MVISGRARGDAPQLADYLTTQGENERITILDVDGGSAPSKEQLQDLLFSMELNSELTRSRKSVYHAFINPNPNEKEDRMMTAEEWQRSADILAKHLDLEQQRRVIVLHEKSGRIHAHVVFERYNHEKGTMIDYSNNYQKHDIARAEMELEFGHKRTPRKNAHQAHHKQKLTELWQQSKNAEDFIKKAEAQGFTIAKGTDRPFMVVDENGRSFDLVRLLDKVKTKEVRERFAEAELVNEKEAIHRTKIKHQFKKSADVSEQKSLNNEDMFFEIQEELKQEQEIFDSLGKKHLEEMEERHFEKAKKYGSFDKIPADVLREMKAERDTWQNKWGDEGEQRGKLNEKYERMMNDTLNDMYIEDLKHKFNQNEHSTTKSEADAGEAFQQNIRSTAEAGYASEREQFVKEMQQAQSAKERGPEI